MAPQRQEGPPARASSQWVRCPRGPRAHAESSTQLDLLAGHRHGRGGGAERPKARLADAALAAPGPARPPPGVGAQPGLCSRRPPHASPSGRVHAVTKRARPGPGCRDPRARDTRATCLAWPPGRARRRGCRAGPGPQRPGCAGWQSPSLEQRPTRAWPLRKAPRNPVFHCAGSSRPQQVRRRGVHRSWGIWGARCSRPGPTTLIRGLWPTGHLPPHSQKNPLNRSVRYKQLVIF